MTDGGDVEGVWAGSDDAVVSVGFEVDGYEVDDGEFFERDELLDDFWGGPAVFEDLFDGDGVEVGGFDARYDEVLSWFVVQVGEDDLLFVERVWLSGCEFRHWVSCGQYGRSILRINPR